MNMGSGSGTMYKSGTGIHQNPDRRRVEEKSDQKKTTRGCVSFLSRKKQPCPWEPSSRSARTNLTSGDGRGRRWRSSWLAAGTGEDGDGARCTRSTACGAHCRRQPDHGHAGSTVVGAPPWHLQIPLSTSLAPIQTPTGTSTEPQLDLCHKPVHDKQ